MIEEFTGKIGRREFLGKATAAGLLVVQPRLARGSEANSALRLGILGCGGRGTAVGTSFVENTNVRVVALADLFADQLEAARSHFDALQQAKGYPALEASQLFRGPKAYQQIVASKEVDVIQITTPPYFHPQHLEAVVEAGKHVYCEKPVAVDAPGARHVLQIGKTAQGKLSLDVGFQIRMAPPMVELTRRIHDGALGKISCGLAHYYCGHINRPDWSEATPQAKKLRNWVWYRDLSGDIIVEQNIHVIDMCNWMLSGHPVQAEGCWSRRYRDDAGDCADNFNAVLIYPENIQVSFGSCQFGQPAFDAAVRLFGTEGSSEAHYDWRVFISGKNPWDAGLGASKESAQFSAAGTFKGSLDQADAEKQKAFVESITSGNFHNQAEQGALSALSAMLGRMAAYTGRLVTWEELLKSEEVYDPKLDLEKFA